MGKGKDLANASMAKISSMEKQLSNTLKPVRPRQEFVNGLGHRIQAGNRAGLVHRLANWHIFAVAIAAFVSLAVLVAMLMRALLALSARKRMA